jgi:uncharacterized protein (TIGR02145 family)
MKNLAIKKSKFLKHYYQIILIFLFVCCLLSFQPYPTKLSDKGDKESCQITTGDYLFIGGIDDTIFAKKVKKIRITPGKHCISIYNTDAINKKNTVSFSFEAEKGKNYIINKSLFNPEYEGGVTVYNWHPFIAEDEDSLNYDFFLIEGLSFEKLGLFNSPPDSIGIICIINSEGEVKRRRVKMLGLHDSLMIKINKDYSLNIKSTDYATAYFIPIKPGVNSINSSFISNIYLNKGQSHDYNMKYNLKSGYIYFLRCNLDLVLPPASPYDALMDLKNCRLKILNNTLANLTLNKAEYSKTRNVQTDSYKYDSFTDIRDGKVYKTIQIGSQVWLAENFAYKPKYGNYWFYNNDSMNLKNCGYLYNWRTAKKVVPKGWHLPTLSEWGKLYEYLGGNDSLVFNSIKEQGNSGLNILYAGYCSTIYSTESPFKYKIDFTDIGTDAYFWIADKGKYTSLGYNYILGSSNYSPVFHVYSHLRGAHFINEERDCGLSVRLIKD